MGESGPGPYSTLSISSLLFTLGFPSTAQKTAASARLSLLSCRDGFPEGSGGGCEQQSSPGCALREKDTNSPFLGPKAQSRRRQNKRQAKHCPKSRVLAGRMSRPGSLPSLSLLVIEIPSPWEDLRAPFSYSSGASMACFWQPSPPPSSFLTIRKEAAILMSLLTRSRPVASLPGSLPL